MSQQAQGRTIPQSKEALLKSYTKRMKDDVRAMIDNYTEIIRLAKVDEDNTQLTRSTQAELDAYEMQVRSANIVRAAEALLKLVSDIKEFLILNDFRAVNEAIVQNRNMFHQLQRECDTTLLNLRDDMSAQLIELEEEYYQSSLK